jgi:glutamate racemase
LLPKHVTIIDSGIAVAKQTAAVLQLNNLSTQESTFGDSAFYSNGNPLILSEILHNEFTVEALDF